MKPIPAFAGWLPVGRFDEFADSGPHKLWTSFLPVAPASLMTDAKDKCFAGRDDIVSVVHDNHLCVVRATCILCMCSMHRTFMDTHSIHVFTVCSCFTLRALIPRIAVNTTWHRHHMPPPGTGMIGIPGTSTNTVADAHRRRHPTS